MRKTTRSFSERAVRFSAGVMFLPYAIISLFLAVLLGLGVLSIALGLLVALFRHLGI